MVVTKDDTSPPITFPPTVTTVWHEGQRAFSIDWASAAGACRRQLPGDWQVEIAPALPSSFAWRVLLDRVGGTHTIIASSEAGPCAIEEEGCVFRVRPLSLRGWTHPTDASAPVRGDEGGVGGGLVATCAALFALLIAAMIIWRVRTRSKSLADFTLKEECADAMREAAEVFISSGVEVRENFLWLHQAWMKGLGLSGIYEHPLGDCSDCDDDDDDEERGELVNDGISLDEYAVRRTRSPFLPSVREEEEDAECRSMANEENARQGEQDDDEFTRL